MPGMYVQDAIPALPEMTRLIVARWPGALVAWLYGSAARGQLRDWSDVDIAVWGRAPFDPLERFALAGELSAIAGRDVDLVDLSARNASSVLRKEVAWTGQVLFADEPHLPDDRKVVWLMDWFDLMDAWEAAGVPEAVMTRQVRHAP
jgi:predicted nucleotidyltransferase